MLTNSKRKSDQLGRSEKISSEVTTAVLPPRACKAILGRRLTKLFTSSIPLFVIAGLGYAGLFIKPKPVGASLPPSTFERGDAFYGLAMPTASTLWIAGTGGKIVRSDDGGATWARQSTPVGKTIQDIAAWDATRAVAVGDRGVVIFTGDSGKSWQEGKAPVSTVANKLMRVRALPGGVAWAVGEFGALLKSEDYGATWIRSAPEEDAAWNDVDFVGESGWVAGEFGRLKRTEDAGRTWQQAKTGIQTSLMAVSFKDARNGVAVGLAGTILVSDDGGATWRQVKSPVREHLFDVKWDGQRWVAVGDKGFVLTSSNPNENWSATPVSQTDRSWHTRVETAGNAFYLAGGTLVAIENGRAKPLGS